MNRTLVSCITIFLNAERFFDEAVASVLAQSYDAWELLLVDDGSTDGSSELARAYAERYPGRIRYLEHPGHENRGMSASRNLGLAHARGELIAFLDADDVWLPDKLASQVALLDAHPSAAMTYGPLYYWHAWEGSPSSRSDHLSPLGVPPNSLVPPPRMVTTYLRVGGTTPGMCNILLRKALLEALGGFEDSFRGLYEDQVLYAKIGLNHPVYVTDKVVAKYRQHEDSCYMTSKLAGVENPFRTNPARETYLSWLERYIHDLGIDDAALNEVVEEELRPYRHPVSFHWQQFRRHPLKKLEVTLPGVLARVLPAPLHRAMQRRWQTYLKTRRDA